MNSYFYILKGPIVLPYPVIWADNSESQRCFEIWGFIHSCMLYLDLNMFYTTV